MTLQGVMMIIAASVGDDIFLSIVFTNFACNDFFLSKVLKRKILTTPHFESAGGHSSNELMQ